MNKIPIMISITELRNLSIKKLLAMLEESDIVVLRHSKPVAVIVTYQRWESIHAAEAALQAEIERLDADSR